MSTAKDLLAFFHAGLFPRETLERGMEELGVRRRWWHWGNLLLLCLGGALMLAGITFFVAYNWMEMDRAVKLGGLQILILACALGAWRRGLNRLDGQALLFAACFLVGVFLAAFGQVFQTGADAYELFRGWALLILLWVIASRSAAHWLLLLVVTDLAIALYWEQVRVYRWETHYGVWLLLAATQFLGLVGLELGHRHKYFWLDQAWPRWILVPAILFQLLVPASIIIFDDKYDKPFAWTVLLCLVAAIPGGYRYYRHVGRDLFALTCIGFATAWVVFAYAFKLLGAHRAEGCTIYAFLGLLVIGMLGGLVRWIRKLAAVMQSEVEGHD